MASTVPVLQVPVDDSQFRAFLEVFEKFKIDAAEIPATMAEIEQAIDRLPEHLRPGADALEEAGATAADVLDDVDAAGGGEGGGGGGAGPSGTSGTGRRRGRGRRRGTRKREPAVALDWAVAGVGARRFATTITGATRDLARWEKLTGVFAGLLGAGGLYGLDVLAGRAAQRRQESAGYGMSTGELASFKTNYGRLGDVGGVLQGLSGAETDFAKRQPLQSLGVDPRGKSSLAVFGEMLPKLKRIADATDSRAFGPAIQARGLDKIGIGVEMMRLIRALPEDEVETIRANAARDAGVLGIPDEVGRRWQELETAFHKAGARFQTVVADELVALTPGLAHLSETAVSLFDKLLARKELALFLDRANAALLRFADDVGSDAAQTKVREFLHHFDMARSDFDALNRWFENHGATLGAVFGAVVGSRFGPVGVAVGAIGGAMVGGSATHEQTMRRQYEGGAAAERPSLVERNAERRGMGLPEYKDQGEYDRAEPSVRNGPLTPDESLVPTNIANIPEAQKEYLRIDSTGAYTPKRSEGDQATKLEEKAVDRAFTMLGKQERVNRTDIEEYLRTGGHGMDPAKIPWCAAFVGSTLAQSGIRDSHSNLAASYHRWGQGVESDQARKGDVIVEGDHHTGMATGRVRKDPRSGRFQVEMISGNHGDRVNLQWTYGDEIDVRRATKKELLHPENVVPRDARATPRDYRTAARSYLSGHPYARPKPAQTVTVTDNSGGSSTVTVAH